MKILGLRGRNLASLAGDFEVDFRQEPLASAGLFAITGPTGAGKSTLLDVLCLALYEQTPRMKQANASRGEWVPDVGEHGLTPNDPRSLLRRGASDGYAEVDFVGNDQHSYRARWSVRRARNRAGGKLQATEMQFLALPSGQELGDHRKTETLKRIEAAIGLNFDQFTRSVLLAQNDFASFLRAADDERAALLQTLTGTQEFSELSQLAYQRMKEEKNRAEQLLQQEALIQALSPAAQQALVQQQAELEAQLTGWQQQQQGLEQQLRWFNRRQQLEQAVQQAQAGAAQHQQHWAAAATRRERLRQLELGNEARPLLTLLERHEQALTLLEQQLHELQAQLAQHTLALQAARHRLDASQAQRQHSEQTMREHAPLLERAQQMDQALAQQQLQLDETQQHFQAAMQRWQHAQQSYQAKQQEHASLLEAIGTIRQRQAPQQAWGETFRHWPHWLQRLRQAQGFAHALQKAQHAAEQQAAARERLSLLVTRHEQAHAEQLHATQAAETKRQQAQQAAQAFQPEHLHRQQQHWLQRRDQLRQAQQQQTQYQTLQEQLARQQTQIDGLHQQRQALSTELVQSEAQNVRLETAARSAEHAYQLARLAASQQAADFRQQLQAETPCPVCGACEHPYAQGHDSSPAWLAPLEAHSQQEQQAWIEARTRQASLVTRLEALHAQTTSLEAEQLSQSEQADRLAYTLKQDCLLLFSEPVQLNALAQALGAALQEAEHTLQALQHSLSSYQAAQSEAEAAHLLLEQLRQQRESSQRDLQTQRDAQAQHQQLQQRHRDEAKTWRQLLDTSLIECDPALQAQADWREAFLHDPDALITCLDRLAQQWLHEQREAERQQGDADRLFAHLQALQQTLPDLAQQQQTWQQRLQPLQQALSQAHAERQQLLDGRRVEEVKQTLQTSLDTALLQHQQALTDFQSAELAHTKGGLAQRHSQQAYTALGSEHAQALRKLQDWLHTQQQRHPDWDWDRQSLETLLRTTPEAMTQEQAALQQLEHALQRSQASLQTQQQNLNSHLSQDPPALSAEALEHDYAQVQERYRSTHQALIQVRSQREADQQRQQAALELKARIANQAEQSRVWNQLSDLIGSADGKKFRNFAQQLTLDVLLSHANQHLDQLSRRYRLMRSPNSLGLMVIDQEMGEERRSVHSLSGGESFLLSLSLALGLASLSSQRVRVETLFIDEGFGSLDADSLSLAMDALDRLQSTGRKVGVITHVQEMTERISTQIRVERLAGGRSQVVIHAL